MAILKCCDGITVCGVVISSDEICAAAERTNEYLIKLDDLFEEIGFNLFEILEQRNISGVIGEIFSQFLASDNQNLENNPHPDGRPDVLSVPNDEVRTHLETCFTIIDGKPMPNKSMLAPFRYGGIEVKCTIGDPIPAAQRRRRGIGDFAIGVSRVDYLSDLNWWAHHTKSSNLLGLYYDYSEQVGGVPQIMAGFFGALTVDNWTKVSIGDAEHKKTSNTSLNKTGKEIMKNQPVFVVDDRKYITALKEIGAAL